MRARNLQRRATMAHKAQGRKGQPVHPGGFKRMVHTAPAGELPHGVCGTVQVVVIVCNLHHVGGAKGLGAL